MGLVALRADASERPAPEVRAEQPSDTLRYSVVSGQPLIVALPRQHEGAEVTYRLLDAPALSWLVDTSFLWRTTEGERGELPIEIERMAPGAATETIVLLVTVLPEGA